MTSQPGTGVDTLPSFETNEQFAKTLDRRDPLAMYRDEFLIPKTNSGHPYVYMAGNSLGCQPVKAREFIEQELKDWAQLGVEGHFQAKNPWVPYHENLTEATARLVGAKPHEVVVMNSLTVNLHLMLMSFYRPLGERYKIVIEANAFPSDQYAVASQAKIHGIEPAEAIVELLPRQGEETLRTEDIVSYLEKEGGKVAVVVLGQCNYLTGQAFDISAITAAAHKAGAVMGVNLAHGAGNLELSLHEWDVDFAVWCSYKYLNAGPGGIAGCFIHERHARNKGLPRLAGWWGHNKTNRFEMGPFFDPMNTAEGWQLSNPPIFQLAALWASMEIFDKATIMALRRKSMMLTGYLEFLLSRVPKLTIITPREFEARGCQLSMRVTGGGGKEIVKKLRAGGVICDFREPDIIRAAPVPLYNSFWDVWKFATRMGEICERANP